MKEKSGSFGRKRGKYLIYPGFKEFFKQNSKMAPTKFFKNGHELELTMVGKMCMSKVGLVELLLEIQTK